jgi:hypothetical protein
VLGASVTSISPNSGLRGTATLPVTFTGANLTGTTAISGLGGGVFPAGHHIMTNRPNPIDHATFCYPGRSATTPFELIPQPVPIKSKQSPFCVT